MSSKHYIHLDSTYRNRKFYPLPSSFIVPISSNSNLYTTTAIQAVDPISKAYPQYSFTGQSINRGPETFNGGSFISPILNINASNIDNFYNGYILQDITLGESRLIIGYIGSSQTVLLDHPFSSTWNQTNTYNIIDPSTSATIQFQDKASLVDNFYTGLFLKDENINQYRQIILYNGNTRTATLNSTFTGWSINNTYTVRGVPSDEQGLITGVSSFSITLSPTSSDLNDYYKGKFIYFNNGPAAGQSRIITSYNGTTKVATVSSILSILPIIGNVYEILPFTKDNSVPLLYSGSVLSQQETVNYEIELISLDLPNKVLIVSPGNRITFYPYVIIELTNDTASSGHTRNIIYSNNPNTTKSTFTASITDVSDPTTSQFITLSSNGMVQTMRFKPNDNLKFSVTLPNGILFNVGNDTESPLEPDPTIQISAVFSIKRLA